MLTQFILDSFLFWTFLSVIVITAIWIGRAAIRIFEYERQVDRGWNDLISRADEMIKKLNDMTHKIENMHNQKSDRRKKSVK